jgi:hypothetical protein
LHKWAAIGKRKPSERGGKLEKFSAAKIAGDYLKLCRNPLRDLRRWLDADRKGRGKGSRVPARPGTRVAAVDGLRPLRKAGGFRAGAGAITKNAAALNLPTRQTQTGPMSMGELYEYHRRNGTLAAFFAMYPQG